MTAAHSIVATNIAILKHGADAQTSPPTVFIESLDNEGRGVGHADGKVVFVEGALPGELVTYSVFRRKPSFEVANVVTVLKPSASRVTPRCRYFGVCGGCAMQHVDHDAQVAAKQRVLEENLARIGKVTPERILPAVYGAPWGYRERARLSVRYVLKKARLLAGFHERKSSFEAEMQTFLADKYPDVTETIRTTGALTDATQATLRKGLTEFKTAFK